MRLARDSLHYGVAVVEPTASNGPPDRCIERFESPQQFKRPDTQMGIRSFGGSPGTRTLDPRLKRALLYQLS